MPRLWTVSRWNCPRHNIQSYRSSWNFVTSSINRPMAPPSTNTQCTPAKKTPSPKIFGWLQPDLPLACTASANRDQPINLVALEIGHISLFTSENSIDICVNKTQNFVPSRLVVNATVLSAFVFSVTNLCNKVWKDLGGKFMALRCGQKKIGKHLAYRV